MHARRSMMTVLKLLMHAYPGGWSPYSRTRIRVSVGASHVCVSGWIRVKLQDVLTVVHFHFLCVFLLSVYLSVSLSGMGIFWLCWNSGILMVPRVILKICLNLGRICGVVYVHYITVSCWSCVLQPWQCPPFRPDSVCPELARRHTAWKWPSVARIHAFRGGLQVTLWQAKIGLRSFVTWLLQSVQRVAQENLFALWDILVVDLASRGLQDCVVQGSGSSSVIDAYNFEMTHCFSSDQVSWLIDFMVSKSTKLTSLSRSLAWQHSIDFCRLLTQEMTKSGL